MKKNYYIFNWITAGIFSLFVLINFFISNGEYSYLENRYLQLAPDISLAAVAERKFMNEAEDYCDDQLIFRDFFVKTKANFERITGKKENNGVYFADNGFLIEKPATKNKELISKNIASINELSKSKRFNVTFLLVPQAFESLKENLPAGTHTDAISDLKNTITKNIKNVSFAYPSDVLNSSENAYYRTDHHLTTYGSYLLYNFLGDKLNYTPLKEDEFRIKTVSENFLGTTYSKALIPSKPDSITVYETDINTSATCEFIPEGIKKDTIFFPEHLEKKDGYSYFLDGNHGLTVIKGGPDGKGNIALIKDSYAHAIAPFLINHYESVHLIDMRYYQNDPIEYLTENKIRDVLFLYGTSTFMTDETIAKTGEFMKTSPYAKIGKVEESAPADDSWFSDALFIGDSLTMGFEAFSGMTTGEYLCRTGLSVEGVFTAEEDGTSIIEKAKAVNPEKIYVLLGANEYIVLENLENVVEKFSKLTDELMKNHPDSMIFIQAIFPYSESKEKSGKIKNDIISEYNKALLNLAEEKGCYFLAPYEAVSDENGYLRPELTHDGIHLNNEGCRLWAEYLRCHTISSGNAVSATAKVVEFKNGKYPLREIADKILNSAEFDIKPETTPPEVLIKTHGISADKIQNAYGLAGAGTTAEEISLFELKDKKDANKIEEILSDYVAKRIKSFDSYLPSETPKLKSAVIYSKDNFVALVVAKDTKKTLNILETAGNSQK